jgi:hypothetical protein
MLPSPPPVVVAIGPPPPSSRRAGLSPMRASAARMGVLIRHNMTMLRREPAR